MRIDFKGAECNSAAKGGQNFVSDLLLIGTDDGVAVRNTKAYNGQWAVM